MRLYFHGGPNDGAMYETVATTPPQTLHLRDPSNWAKRTTYVLNQADEQDALYYAADSTLDVSAIEAAE